MLQDRQETLLSMPVIREPEGKTFKDGALRLLYLSRAMADGAMADWLLDPYIINEEPEAADLLPGPGAQ